MTEFKSDTGLSKRGLQALLTSENSKEKAILKEFYNFKPFNTDKNKSGHLDMTCAENSLMWDIIKAKLEKIHRETDLPNQMTKYGDFQG